MKVLSKALNGGTIPDRFGKRGTDKNRFGVPNRSVPIQILEAPTGTESFAIILEDKDAVPVCGFSWIHWIAADITKTEIPENDSIHAKDYVQGINSWVGAHGKEGAIGYGGMTPPDAPHVYELHVFALDKKLNLKNGFFVDELYQQMEDHILAREKVYGTYSN